MATNCVGKNRCSSHAPGWLSTQHPSVDDGIVSGRVCFHWSSGCCHWSTNIRIRNCSGFYVYELGPPPTCWLRYCGNREANNTNSSSNGSITSQAITETVSVSSPPPVYAITPTKSSSYAPFTASFPGSCSHHVYSSTYYYYNLYSPGYPGCYPNNEMCIWLIEAPVGYYVHMYFYQFSLEYGGSNCPNDFLEIRDGNTLSSPLIAKICGPLGNFYIYSSGRFLILRFYSNGFVQGAGLAAYYRSFNYRSNNWIPSQHVSSSSFVTCLPSQTHVTRISTTLPITPTKSSSYIPSTISLSECFIHGYLDDSVRAQGFYNGYYGYYQCDRYLPFGWYRFRGAAGTQMATNCVGKNRCSSHAPGWLSTQHPSVDDGIVSGRVCFHWSSGCCTWSTNIRIRNCSGFYVYELGPPPACWLRYCGNSEANNTNSSSNGSITSQAITATVSVSSPPPVYAITPTKSSSYAPFTASFPGSCSHHVYSSTYYYKGLYSPGYPGCYPNNEMCVWLIEAPVGYYVYMYFYQLSLEYGGSNCPNDFLEIRDGNTLSSPLITKICGPLGYFYIYSSGRFLILRFQSDGIVQGAGFAGHYISVSQRYNNWIPSKHVSSSSFVTCVPSQTHVIRMSTTSPVIYSVSSSKRIKAGQISPASPSGYYVPSSSYVLPAPVDFQFHVPADCDQICTNTQGSYRCSCVRGYRLSSDGKSCLDIDECSTNNGGCSHRCYNIPGSFYCGCPEGTTMASNNLTCVEPGVSVACDENNMTISLEKQTFPFFNVSTLHLRYSSCRATQNSTHVIISTPLNACGTLVNETEDALIFWNEVRADAVIIDNVITRTHDIKLKFYCSYSRKKMLSIQFKPKQIFIGSEAGYGNFTFKMDFYKTAAYATRYTANDYPIPVTLNEYLYVKYSVESSADLVIMAETCKATKYGNFYSWPQYNIIQNGCKRDTTMEYTYNPSGRSQQFKLQAFRFFNDYDVVYFHCELLACYRYSSNSRCSRSCLSSKRRKRRGTVEEEIKHEESTSRHILSSGPIKITDTEKREKGDTGQSQKAALIGGAAAGGGFALIAIIALAVLAAKYRLARRLINRNKVGDLYTTQDEQLSRRNAYIQEDDMIEKEDSF